MRITKVTKRKDGKFLVGLGFTNGVHLRKIMTPEDLQKTVDRIAKDKELERSHHR